MKKYEKPIVIANSELFEGVYAQSGDTPPGFDYEIKFSDHDSGSHSELWLDVINNNDKTYNSAIIKLSWNGNGDMVEIRSISGPNENPGCSISGKDITITENMTINPNQRLHYSCQIVFNGTGDGHSFATPDNPHKDKGSYMEGYGKNRNSPAPFTVSVKFS